MPLAADIKPVPKNECDFVMKDGIMYLPLILRHNSQFEFGKTDVRSDKCVTLIFSRVMPVLCIRTQK